MLPQPAASSPQHYATGHELPEEEVAGSSTRRSCIERHQRQSSEDDNCYEITTGCSTHSHCVEGYQEQSSGDGNYYNEKAAKSDKNCLVHTLIGFLMEGSCESSSSDDDGDSQEHPAKKSKSEISNITEEPVAGCSNDHIMSADRRMSSSSESSIDSFTDALAGGCMVHSKMAVKKHKSLWSGFFSAKEPRRCSCGQHSSE